MLPNILLYVATLSLVSALNIDNGLTGEPQVDCQDTMISLTFKTEKPFTGRIYVKGLVDDNRCSRSFATNDHQTKFSMIVRNGDCNMARKRMNGEEEGVMYSLVVVVSFHGTFVTKVDRAFRCMCFFRNIKRVTNLLDMSMIATTSLLDTAKMPTCSYTIRSDSADGPLMRYGKIGDAIFHVWECDDPNFGFLVHSCFVNDGRGKRFDLVDIDGCSIDPVIQPDIQYQESLNKAFTETYGYKYSDTSVLDYQCVLELCNKKMGECEDLTPPKCSRGKREIKTIRSERFVAVKGESDTTAPNQIDVNAGLKMLDTIDDEIGTPTTTFAERMIAKLNRYYSAQYIPANKMCLSTPAFGLIVGINIVLTVAVFAAVAILCSRSRKIHSSS